MDMVLEVELILARHLAAVEDMVVADSGEVVVHLVVTVATDLVIVKSAFSYPVRRRGRGSESYEK